MTRWRVAGYTEVRTLGEGAQGRVVLARHDGSGAPVAIKYVAAGADAEARERLKHEARMLARADSPHVARLYRLVESGQGAAIIMEAVDGVSLKTVLERQGSLAPEAALSVLKGSLLGLAAAHALGVVHRDYKPANVVVPADGRSKLVDFGIAAPAGREAGGAGTPYYMAPEQWTRHTATPATDVYAATCVFVECVTGHRPYAGTRDQLRAAHLARPAPVEDVPEALRPLVAHGMAKDPGERPASAADFVAELERVAAGTYGPGWEERGVRALAVSAAGLAALFPLAAWTLAPAGTGATAGAAGTAAGGQAAVAGKGFLATVTGKVAVGAGTAVLVAGGAVAVRQVTAETAPPRPVRTTPAAALVSVQNCTVTDVMGRDLTPKDRPAPVRLPEQVRLPEGAAVYRVDGRYLIGPAERGCSKSTGVTGGAVEVGDARTGSVSRPLQFSVGNIASMACTYFPESPEAAKVPGCTSDLTGRRRVPTGVPGLRAVLAGRFGGAASPELRSPYVAVTMALMGSDGMPNVINCAMPKAREAVCTAALTHWFLQSVAGKPMAKADRDRIVQRVAAHVSATRY
ncbi:serine/threonine-protein kinase [Actinomadura kijaniata]|uniref:serine/threonine-protein kinase n=1 Tax=Actinomadura kijaniata TaxID=46161 RepID=UPI000829F85E|nr:serine/threonine-protein kinase [Actinomadura kijaniata]